MKIRNIALGVLGAVVLLGGAAFVAIKTDPLFLVRITVFFRAKPLPPQVVNWEQGPAAVADPAAKRPPNIVVIIADDLGFNDLTYNGGGVANGAVPTPNIDSIAHDGVTLTHGYSGNATCAPSRAAIVTGRYATRFGYEFTPTHAAFQRLVGTFHSPGSLHSPIYHSELVDQMPPEDKIGIPPSEITIAKLLQQQGYHTLMFGKWHLGEGPGMKPNEQGFNESLGFLVGGQMYMDKNDPNVVNSIQDFDPIDQFLWTALPFTVSYNNGPVFTPPTYMTDYLGDEAVKAVAANKNRPFFMYLAFNAPHTPLQALKSDYDSLSAISDHRLRVYGAMIKSLDRNVGKVLTALKDAGVDDNTIVIFTSDNGGAHYIGLPEINRPYRGWKATFFEGGIHVPYFIRWPGNIQAGTKYDAPVGHVDIFATAAGAAGAPLPTDRKLDGVNLIPYIQGQNSERPHKTLFWRSGGYRVLLDEDWKLQVSENPQKVWLFDLKADPLEQTNLAETNPQKVAELQAVLAEINGEQAKPGWPALMEGGISIDHPLSVPDKPEDEYIYWSN